MTTPIRGHVTLKVNHPMPQARSFSTILLLEMWERFGFYGMQVLIVYYLIEQLGFSDKHANLTWSTCVALIYTTPAIGGWVGDKILGTRRTMLLGAIVLTLGYGLLGVPHQPVEFIFFALGVIIVGNGLFKANAGNMVRKIYEGSPSKMDSAFTLYYMGVNMGSMISMLLTPWVKDYINTQYGYDLGWYVAFAISGFGLAIGLGSYFLMRRTLTYTGSEPDALPLKIGKLGLVIGSSILMAFLAAFILKHEAIARLFIYMATAAIFFFFTFFIYTAQPNERSGLLIALILTIQVIFFFIFYQQTSSSLALFILRNVDWNFNVFGFHVFTWAPAQFQALNPIWIFILSPILAWVYAYAGNRGRDLPIAGKFALGFTMMAISFFIYGAVAYFSNIEGKISSWIIVWGYGFGALGELLISGLGLAMIARYGPARMGGFMMGVYFIATGISQYFGGWIATLASIPKEMTDPIMTLPIYTHLFNWLGIAGLGCALIASAMLPIIRKLSLTFPPP